MSSDLVLDVGDSIVGSPVHRLGEIQREVCWVVELGVVALSSVPPVCHVPLLILHLSLWREKVGCREAFRALGIRVLECFCEKLLAYDVSEMVHGESVAKDVGVLVVCVDVFSVGEPHEMSLQLLSLGLVALPVLRLPQIPLLWVLVLHLTPHHCQ